MLAQVCNLKTINRVINLVIEFFKCSRNERWREEAASSIEVKWRRLADVTFFKVLLLVCMLHGFVIVLTFVDLTEGARSELFDDLEAAF